MKGILHHVVGVGFETSLEKHAWIGKRGRVQEDEFCAWAPVYEEGSQRWCQRDEFVSEAFGAGMLRPATPGR